MATLSNEIPSRTLTRESTKVLSNTLERALSEMLHHLCPCHFPRFRYLVSFHHDNYKAGPVFCADSNYLVGAACRIAGFLTPTERITKDVTSDYGVDYIYTCQKCGTVYKRIYMQYSINFEFECLVVLESKHSFDIGADVVFPIPLLQGLFGFQDDDILKCAKEYRLGDSNDVFKYLICKKNDFTCLEGYN